MLGYCVSSSLITLWQSSLTKALRNTFCSGFTLWFFGFDIWLSFWMSPTATRRILRGLKTFNLWFQVQYICVVDSPNYFPLCEAALPVAWNTFSKSRCPWEWVTQYKVLWQAMLNFAAQLHMTRIVGSIEMCYNNTIRLPESWHTNCVGAHKLHLQQECAPGVVVSINALWTSSLTRLCKVR